MTGASKAELVVQFYEVVINHYNTSQLRNTV